MLTIPEFFFCIVFNKLCKSGLDNLFKVIFALKNDLHKSRLKLEFPNSKYIGCIKVVVYSFCL